MENLTNEELVELYQKGNDYAATVLWDKNQGLVYKTISKFKNFDFVDMEDKLSACHIAFTRSIKKYNGESGYKFSTYFCRALNSAIIREADLNGLIRDAKKLKDSTVSYNALMSSGSTTEFWERLPELSMDDEYFSESLADLDKVIKKSFQYATEKLNEPYKDHIPKVILGKLKQSDVCEITGKSPQSVHYQIDRFRENVFDYINLSKESYILQEELKGYFNIDMIGNKKEGFIRLLESRGLKKNSNIMHINDFFKKHDLSYSVVLNTTHKRINGKQTSIRYWKLTERELA